MFFSMNIYLALALCFLPLAIVFFALWKFAKINTLLLLLAFVFGGIALAPASILQIALPFPEITNWHLSLLHALFVIGFIEEGVKALAIFFLPAKKLTALQFFLLALFAGLAFGTFESALFFLKQFQKASSFGAELLYRDIFVRMFTSDVVHSLAASLSGLSIFAWKHKRFSLLPILFAIVLHGLYDFFELYDSISYFAHACILLLALEGRSAYVKQAKKENGE